MILTQRDRVRLGRNDDWTEILQSSTKPYPSGLKFHTVPLLSDPEETPAEPASKNKKSNPRGTKDSTTKKRKQQSLEQSEDDEDELESAAPPPPKRRKETLSTADQMFEELHELSQDVPDRDLKKWIKTHYPQQAKSITITGRKQTLQILASLLVP